VIGMADPAAPASGGSESIAAASATTATGALRSPRIAAAARVKQGRDAARAAFEASADPAERAAPAAPAKPIVVETETETETDSAIETEAAETPALAAKPVADVEAASRQKQLQRQEEQQKARVAEERKRSRDEAAAERAELERERAAVAAERAELEQFRRARENAKRDPVALLRAAGVTDAEDLAYAGRMAYAEGKGDPKDREAATRLQREREQGSTVEKLQKRLDDFEARDAERVAAAQHERAQNSWLDDAAKAVTDATPVAKALGAKNPTKLRGELWTETLALANELGGFDDIEPADVVARFEKRQLAALADLGVDITKYSSAATASAEAATTETKQNPKAAEKKNPAKTLGTNLDAPRAPRTELSQRDRRAESRALFEAGKLE
jgi:hypothetical protein